MFLHRKFSPGFSRAVDRLLRSLPGIRHTTGAPPAPDAATTMEKLDAALNNMSHGLCMFGPDNRLPAGRRRGGDPCDARGNRSRSAAP